MITSRNVCRFVGQLRSFNAMMVGEYKHLCWGYGTLFLPDHDRPGTGLEIRIQAWEDNAETLGNLPYGTWIKVTSVFAPSEFRGAEQANFVIGNLVIIENDEGISS